MGKTFINVSGKVNQLDIYDYVDVDEDIVTGAISGYYIVSDDYGKEEVDKETYEAAKEYFES